MNPQDDIAMKCSVIPVMELYESGRIELTRYVNTICMIADAAMKGEKWDSANFGYSLLEHEMNGALENLDDADNFQAYVNGLEFIYKLGDIKEYNQKIESFNDANYGDMK